jgi:hypothetical protein
MDRAECPDHAAAFHIIRMLVTVEVLSFMKLFEIQPPTIRESSWIIVVLFWIAAGVVGQLLVFAHGFVLVLFLVDIWEVPRNPLLARLKQAARQAWVG